jgi:outer membrane immunogenic protein
VKKVLLAAAVACIAFAAPALAADMPVKAPAYKAPPAVFNWTGWYVGGHIGGAWGDDRITDVAEITGNRFSNKPTGIFGGGQLGFNVQNGQVVWGGEVDLGAMDLHKRVSEPLSAGLLASQIKSGFYSDVTGRLGYAWDRSLLYAKGGYAFYGGSIKNIDNDPGEGVTFGKSGSSGWTAGGGFEQMINAAWSWKVEYLYFNFGTIHNVNPVDTPDIYINKFTVQTVKVGLNYKFDWGKSPVVAKY